MIKKFTYALAVGKKMEMDDDKEPGMAMEDLKKKMVDLELHSGLNKDMMLLTNEQKRQELVLQ